MRIKSIDSNVGPNLVATTKYFTRDSNIHYQIKNVNNTEDGLQMIRHVMIEEEA